MKALLIAAVMFCCIVGVLALAAYVLTAACAYAAYRVIGLIARAA